MEIKAFSEDEIRAMRDKVYGDSTSDKNWEGCRDRWIDDVKWLSEQLPKAATPSVK